jgi:hypothetical protein
MLTNPDFDFDAYLANGGKLLDLVMPDEQRRLPVTLKFADRVGEILTASPRGMEAPPLPFRFYI